MLSAWASISEKGTANGIKGDQTTKEVKIGNYYNFGQNEFLRPKNEEIGKKIAIAVKCNIDCSELALCAVNFALGYAALPSTLYTGNIRLALLALKDKNGKHLFSCLNNLKEKDLKVGDLPLKAGHHIIVVIGSTDYKYKGKEEKETNKKEETKVKDIIKAPKGTPLLKEGSKGDRVKDLQKALNKDYNCGLNIDGIIGPLTTKAINSHMVRNFTVGEFAKWVQERLIAKGYSLNEFGVDGRYGNESEKKVKEFQANCGIDVDGIVGINTVNRLI